MATEAKNIPEQVANEDKNSSNKMLQNSEGYYRREINSFGFKVEAEGLKGALGKTSIGTTYNRGFEEKNATPLSLQASSSHATIAQQLSPEQNPLSQAQPDKSNVSATWYSTLTQKENLDKVATSTQILGNLSQTSMNVHSMWINQKTANANKELTENEKMRKNRESDREFRKKLRVDAEEEIARFAGKTIPELAKELGVEKMENMIQKKMEEIIHFGESSEKNKLDEKGKNNENNDKSTTSCLVM